MCKWDADAKDYLADGQPCRHDVDGWPTKHCTAKDPTRPNNGTRQRCSQHIGQTELTCGRCIADTRQNLRWIPDLAPLALIEALDDGTNSQAAMLAGPAADYSRWSARRTISRRWLYTNIPTANLERALTALLDDEDTLHPFSVLTRWHWMVSEAYGHPLPEVMTIIDSANYLDRNLHRIAQDETQAFARLRSEIRRCREHLESVIHNSSSADHGAPCPECVGGGNVDPANVRLCREYGSICDDPECGKVHYRRSPSVDDEREAYDRWVCPKNRDHWWTAEAYRNWVEERQGA